MARGKKEISEQEETIKYTKEQFIQAKRYTHQKDIINVLLNDDTEYTFGEVDNIINEFLEREV